MSKLFNVTATITETESNGYSEAQMSEFGDAYDIEGNDGLWIDQDNDSKAEWIIENSGDFHTDAFLDEAWIDDLDELENK